MTLNGVIALILLYFTEFDSFAGLLRHRDWSRPRLYCPQNIVFNFGQNWPTAQRGLSAIAVLLVVITSILDNESYNVSSVPFISVNYFLSFAAWCSPKLGDLCGGRMSRSMIVIIIASSLIALPFYSLW